ncbi:MAG: hypothetical protein K6F84_02095 [Lachnospiraceae bacterium]|nr:hypothetical protein [Lachnospiraceae bacterium]
MDETNIVINPGVRLLSEITKRGMKQSELAIRTGATAKHISTVINGTKEISMSFARKLDIALGDKSGTWVAYQAEYDAYQAELEEKNGITEEEIAIFKRMKDIVDYFIDKIKVMHNGCGVPEKIIQLRKLLCVTNLTVIPQITYNAAYRAQVKSSTAIDSYILFAWQRLCEIQTEKTDIALQFDSKKLSDSILAIKEQMFETDPNTMVNNIKAIFAECGVAFDVVRHFRGAPVQGFIKETENGKVILCVTIRGKNADRFWFSLFHEVGHLLNGDLSTRFVDFDTVRSEMEDNADSFARDTLINPEHYKNFLAYNNYHDLAYIKRFAQYEGVPHWIVIGRLHSDEWLDWSTFAHELPKFEWVKD